MAEVQKKDAQQELEELIEAQKILEEQIKTQREIARTDALSTIKRMFESHAFEYKDVKEFIKAPPVARKNAARKTVTPRKKRAA